MDQIKHPEKWSRYEVFVDAIVTHVDLHRTCR